MDRHRALLDFLKDRGEASLDELATHLQMSKQGVLRHLQALERDGLVETHAGANHSGPGRPRHTVKLTSRAADRFPVGHRQLAGELVQFLQPEQLERFFAGRAARLEAANAGRMAGKDLRGRLQELARIATENGHMASVVELADGSLGIRQCNCPIGDVAAETRQPCRAEHALYERLLGVEVERTTFIPDSATCCTYVVKGVGAGKNKLTRRHTAAAS